MKRTCLLALALLVACAPDSDGDGFSADVDCDDDEASIHPGAVEHCDGVDENCDGAGDDGAVDAVDYYEDADADGYGVTTSSVAACGVPSGYAELPGDCNDADATVNPGASELCNGVDDDCNGPIDDNATDAPVFYTDADGDGYGDASAPFNACVLPPNASSDPTDCDDAQDDVYPGAPELCNGVDDDCNGFVDDDCGGPGPSVVMPVDDVGVLWTNPLGANAGGDGDVVGDVDGDGYDDLVIGDSSYDGTQTNQGAAWLIYGSATPTGGTLDAEATWVHPLGDRKFGQRAVGLGDVDGDGYDDFGFGMDGSQRGALYLFYGSPTRFSGSQDPTVTADATFSDTITSEPFPSAVSRVGDVDGDGFDDFAMAQSRYHGAVGFEGAVYLVYGSATRLSGTIDMSSLTLLVGDPDDEIGPEKRSVGHGDFDGDGLSDIAVGTWGNQNPRAHVRYGDAQLGQVSVPFADATFTLPPSAVTRMGETIGGIGDLDDDGYEDLCIATSHWDGPGSRDGLALVEPGGAARWGASTDADVNALLRVEGGGAEHLGTAVSPAIDLDDDGVDDLVVSGTWWDTTLLPNAGTIATFYGNSALSGTVQTDDAALRLEGLSADSNLGTALGSGDVDGDGRDDLWATSTGYGAGGAGWLILGSNL